ncbi:MAG TPA: LysR substrate-binding domain-containing protein [Vicinamibacterales bacterium]|nr:LysR substrate-binding domain-containing protein [Vicinamibacterales bacterium]
MELRHLRYVVTVADTLHFGQAAERLHLSQPPLSQQIRQLETELGVSLFHRTKRHVELTDAGRMFVEEARVILAHAAHASNLALRVNQGEVGQLSIGAAGPADARIFVDILRAFARRHPQIRMVVRNMASAEQTRAINEGRLHVGFVALPIDEPDLATETILRRPIVIALPRTHPLASRARVPLEALANEPHIMFTRRMGPRLFDAVIAACREAGFAMQIAHEVDNLYTACALVAAGLGVCFVPAGIQQKHSNAVVLRPVTPTLPHVDSQLAIAYKPQSCELVSLFMDVAREVLAAKRTRAKHPRLRRAARTPKLASA